MNGTAMNHMVNFQSQVAKPVSCKAYYRNQKYIELMFSKMCELKHQSFIFTIQRSSMSCSPHPNPTHTAKNYIGVQNFVDWLARISGLWEVGMLQTESQNYLGLYLVPLIATNYKLLQLAYQPFQQATFGMS